VRIAWWSIMPYFTNDAPIIRSLHLPSRGRWRGLILVFVLPVIEVLLAREVKPKNVSYSELRLEYSSLSWGLLRDVRSVGMVFDGPVLLRDLGYLIPAGLIFAIWINDTMAYIVGSLIGKTPFSSISPKKTWEGTLGGAILCIAIVSLTAWLMKGLPVIHWVMISLIAAVVGTVGDLLQSKLIRLAAVKDSGSIMPGHGGFLDRFDSLVLAVPFVWLYVSLFVR